MSNLTLEDIALEIQRELLGGQGKITQLPGKAAPEVQKYYKTHKGYDYGLPEGSAVTPSFSGEAVDLGVQGGYGRRILVTNPQTGKSYYLSHLSGVNSNQPKFQFQAGQPIAYTGGTPGKYGSGWSTGSHIDVELGGNNPDYQQLIARNNMYNGSGRKINLGSIADKVKSKYGKSAVAISGNRQKLEELAKKRGGQVVKITI